MEILDAYVCCGSVCLHGFLWVSSMLLRPTCLTGLAALGRALGANPAFRSALQLLDLGHNPGLLGSPHGTVGWEWGAMGQGWGCGALEVNEGYWGLDICYGAGVVL